jgi:hypothetical protein
VKHGEQSRAEQESSGKEGEEQNRAEEVRDAMWVREGVLSERRQDFK